VGALRSPFFCLSDDGLYWLVTARGGDPAEGLRHADEMTELSEQDRRHATRARDLLGRWRDLKDRVPIAALVDRVLDESGYEAALLGEYFGARKRANARKLVRLARQFDLQGGFTVADLVARLRADLRRAPREEQAATTDEEGTSIRLMSIHQAKGLEFPIVVLPDLNRKPGGFSNFVAFHPELGPLVRVGKDASLAATSVAGGIGDDAGPDGSGQGLGWLTYQSIEQREEDEESLRLFYVATTRARDALILSAGLSPEEKAGSPALGLLAERFDRATGRCLARLPDGWAVPSVHVTGECPPSPEVVARPRVVRPDLREVAETILRATVIEETTPRPIRPRRPRFVDLDPAAELPPTLARLDRLIRAILADPRAFHPKEVARVAKQAARRQQPAAHGGLIAEALDRLRPWLEGPFGRMLAEAEVLERGLTWTVNWPPEAPDRTVFQGTVDFLFRDRRGGLCAVVLGLTEAPAPRQRLRLLLGSHAAQALDFGPSRQSWLLRLGPGGGLQGEEVFEPGAIDAAVREAIVSPEDG
jgi:ATP-dependent helicase/nuclease subunit A